MSTTFHGPPSGIRPAILIVAGPDDIDAYRHEFAKRYDEEYDLRTATCGMDCETLAEELLAEGIPIAMAAMAIELPDCSFEDVVADMQRISPTSRRLCVPNWSRLQPTEIERVREAVSDGLVDGYLGLPRGPRDEEFHTAIAEMLSEWGWSTVAAFR